MSRIDQISHEFVEFMPENLLSGRIYISLKYSTAIHLCFCGCDSEVVTPLSPIMWQLTDNGDSISLSPSIGNWNLPCRSHYWITSNWVRWA